MNVELLLSYTKLPEDLVEDVFDIDPPKQPPERLSRRAQILRDELLALPAASMLRCSEAAVSRSNVRCRSRLISPPSSDPK